MTVEELNELAEESPETTSLREKLEKDKETLQNGLDKCRRYRPRRITGKLRYGSLIESPLTHS